MTNEEGKELLDVLMDAGSKVTNERFKTAVKKEAATVRFVNGDDVYIRPMSDVSTPTVANPTQLSDLDAGDVLLPNETWQSLSAGDLVEVVYAQSLNDGFIIRKIGVGNALICDTMDERQRRCSAGLSTVTWRRVLTYDASSAADARAGDAFVITFTITQTYGGANNGLHIIKLLGVYNSFAFVEEISRTNINNITYIRYTIDSNNKGHVDICYNATTSNRVSVDFDVCGRLSEKSKFIAESMQQVDTAPSGETVVLTYQFNANSVHPNIWHGTGSPSGGHDGDVFIKHS